MKDQTRAFFVPLFFLGSVYFLIKPFKGKEIAFLFLALIYILFTLPLMLVTSWGSKAKSQNAKNERSVFSDGAGLNPPQTVLWQGDWVKTKDTIKRTVLLILGRMAIPLMFYASASALFLRLKLTEEAVKIFLVWIVLGFCAHTTGIIKDTIKEEKERQKAAHDGSASGGDMASDKTAQLDDWLKNGLIDREEYRVLKESFEKNG